MRRPALWGAAVLAAAVLGVVVGVAWRDRLTPLTPRPAAPPASTTPGPVHAPAPRPEAAPAGDPFLHVEGTTLAAADADGRQLWELQAAQLSVDTEKQRVVLTRASGQFYSSGAVQVTFNAPSAVFHVTSRDVEMTGGVVGRTADGRLLQASRIRWHAAQRTMRAAGTVVLTQPGVAIHADRLVADAALDQIQLSGNVRVQVTE